MEPAGGDGGVPAGGLGGGLGGCEGERRAGEPAVGGGGGGEEADAGQPAVAPGVVALALLEAELDAAGFELAGHDAHLADREVKRGAGEPVAGGGGGGEEADAGELAVAPGVVGLALLEAELDAAAFEFARHDPHRRAVAAGGVLLGDGSGGHDGAAQDGEQGDDRRAGARRLPRGPLRAAGTFVEAGRDGMADSSADRAPPLDQPGGSSPVDITDTPDIAGCAEWPMAGIRGEDHQEPCHTGISTPRGAPWRASNVDGILRSRRLDAEAAQTTAPRSSTGPPAAVEILGNEIATAAAPDRHQAARSGPRALAGR